MTIEEQLTAYRAIVRRCALTAWRTARGHDESLVWAIRETALSAQDEMRARRERLEKESPVGFPIALILGILQIISLIVWLYTQWKHREPQDIDEREVEALASVGIQGT
jgi:hypothetical protein